jgi:hypothetical protein
MLMFLGRLADWFSTVITEGVRDANARREESDLHPVGFAVTAVVLAISVVAFAVAAAFALDHLMDAALAFTLGQSA